MPPLLHIVSKGPRRRFSRLKIRHLESPFAISFHRKNLLRTLIWRDLIAQPVQGQFHNLSERTNAPRKHLHVQHA